MLSEARLILRSRPRLVLISKLILMVIQRTGSRLHSDVTYIQGITRDSEHSLKLSLVWRFSVLTPHVQAIAAWRHSVNHHRAVRLRYAVKGCAERQNHRRHL